jgi:hypothetical protein
MGRNDKVLSVATTTKTGSENSAAFDLGNSPGYAIQSVWDVTTPTAKTFIPGVAEVQTLTFETEANAADGDYVVVETSAGTKYAVAMSKQGAEVKTLTFLAKASCVAGDFMLFYDASGVTWGVSINKSGTDAEPTAKGWTDLAAAKKAHVDISADTTAAQVAARVETALNALTGFSTAFTTDDTAADGTMILTCDSPGPTAEPTSHKKDAGTGASSGAGTSVVGEQTTAGYLTAEPTGDIWTAIAAANKTTVDVTGAGTAAAVAALAETAFNSLTGFTAAITTDDTAADGTMTLTQVEVGSTTNPVLKNADDTGAGGILGVQTTAGTGGVNLGTNAVLSTGHTMATGLKVRLTTATTLPAGLALATDYYIIAVDADHVKFATSLANALAGTAVDITDTGTGTHTITAEALSASVKLQASVDGETWEDVASTSTNITADSSVIWNIADAYYPYVRQALTLTGGQITLATRAYSKG